MFLASSPVATFRCPGELHTISRGVHNARQAAGYEKCRYCPQRDAVFTPDVSATGVPTTVAGSQSAEPAFSPADSWGRPGLARRIFLSHGVRGAYLNEIDRRVAGEIAGAFADVLWSLEPVEATAELVTATSLSPADDQMPEGITVIQPGVPGPAVVLAHDSRPHSLDLSLGVCLALRRMGCQVVDLGLASRPEFLLTVRHLRAAGGVLVTGAGLGPIGTGLDFVGRLGEPWSNPGELQKISLTWQSGYSRPTRRPGGLRSFRLGGVYAGQFQPLLHGLRPLRIAWGSPVGSITATLRALLQQTACRLLALELGGRSRDLSRADDPDVRQVADRVLGEQAHVGFVVGDDGQQCAVLDERGCLVPPERIGRLLATGNDSGGAENQRLAAGTPPQVIWNLVREERRVPGDPQSGHWFADPDGPVCDALRTLFEVLQVLSTSDADLSSRLLPGGEAATSGEAG